MNTVFVNRINNVDPKKYMEDAKTYGISELVYVVCEETNTRMNLKAADEYSDKWITKPMELAPAGLTVGMAHKIGNKIASATQARAFADRAAEHASHSHMGALYAMFSPASTVSAGGGDAYVKYIRDHFPKLKLVYVGPGSIPCAGAQAVIEASDKMILSTALDWNGAYHGSFVAHQNMNKVAKIAPMICLRSATEFGYTAPAKKKHAAQAIEFYKAAMRSDCWTVGIWNHEMIAYVDKLMLSLIWTRETAPVVIEPIQVDDVETVTMQDITDPEEQHKYLWADFLKRNGISQ